MTKKQIKKQIKKVLADTYLIKSSEGVKEAYYFVVAEILKIKDNIK